MNKILLTLLATGLLAPLPSLAKDFTKQDIQAIIKEYIQNNPEVVLDSVESYGKKQQQAEMKDRQKAVDDNIGWLENNKMLPVAGNPDGDVTVIEFFDYNCGYCKKAMSDVRTLLGEDKNVKFLFVEMPILGRTSELAAKWALAAKNQDAYLDYHFALMGHRGPLTESSLRTMAKKIGLDVEKMSADAQSFEIADQVTEKAAKAASMGISGTPAFIIDGQLYGGYIGIDKMRDAVKEARKEKK